jgi:hypothetical protein
MTNLEKAQAWVDSRKSEGSTENPHAVLADWEAAARRSRTNIDDYADEKYGWVLRAIELANSDDPFSIMTASELAFAERMCDREPRVYLEGAALKDLEDMIAVARAEVAAENEIIRLERIEMERAKPTPKPSSVPFEELFP